MYRQKAGAKGWVDTSQVAILRQMILGSSSVSRVLVPSRVDSVAIRWQVVYGPGERL